MTPSYPLVLAPPYKRQDLSELRFQCNLQPLDDHLVDLLDGEPKVGGLEAGELVGLEQGVVVHTLVEVVTLHLQTKTWYLSKGAIYREHTCSLPSGISSLAARTAPVARSGTPLVGTPSAIFRSFPSLFHQNQFPNMSVCGAALVQHHTNILLSAFLSFRAPWLILSATTSSAFMIECKPEFCECISWIHWARLTQVIFEKLSHILTT